MSFNKSSINFVVLEIKDDKVYVIELENTISNVNSETDYSAVFKVGQNNMLTATNKDIPNGQFNKFVLCAILYDIYEIISGDLFPTTQEPS